MSKFVYLCAKWYEVCTRNDPYINCSSLNIHIILIIIEVGHIPQLIRINIVSTYQTTSLVTSLAQYLWACVSSTQQSLTWT